LAEEIQCPAVSVILRVS